MGSISCKEYHEVKLHGLSKGAKGSARCSSWIGGAVELQERFNFDFGLNEDKCKIGNKAYYRNCYRYQNWQILGVSYRQYRKHRQYLTDIIRYISYWHLKIRYIIRDAYWFRLIFKTLVGTWNYRSSF